MKYNIKIIKNARAKRVKLNQKFSNFKSNLLILVMQISERKNLHKPMFSLLRLILIFLN